MSQRCIPGFSRHRWDENGNCTREGCTATRDSVKQSRAGGSETAPKRGGPRYSKTQTMQSIFLLVSGVQAIGVALAPEFQEDALNPQEIAMLADALTDEVEAYPKVRRWIGKIQKNSVHAKLVITLLMIAIPRLVRRGILPEGSGELVSASLGAVAAGATSGPNRGDGFGEVDFSVVPPDDEEILHRDTDETGRREVSGTDSDEVSPNNRSRKVRSNRVEAGVS